MGAHPTAPSEIELGGCWRALTELIDESPGEVLGESVLRRFGTALPFLFKVLAADKALSIQAHPDAEQARVGFEREARRGLALSASERNYRDPRAKPEILYALEPFHILRGFRPCTEIAERLRPLGLLEALPGPAAALLAGDLRRFFEAYLALDAATVQRALAVALSRIGDRTATDEAWYWVVELANQFPGDRGALAPLFLHLMELKPGEAIYTGPGILHAYLRGVGVELMANSDNVVRGGLTSKHVDRPELLAILRFDTVPPQCLAALGAATERRFVTPAEEIELAGIEVSDAEPYVRGGRQGVEILLCTAGEGEIGDLATGSKLSFIAGDSFLVPAAVRRYSIEGTATIFRASVGIEGPSSDGLAEEGLAQRDLAVGL